MHIKGRTNSHKCFCGSALESPRARFSIFVSIRSSPPRSRSSRSAATASTRRSSSPTFWSCRGSWGSQHTCSLATPSIVHRGSTSCCRGTGSTHVSPSAAQHKCPRTCDPHRMRTGASTLYSAKEEDQVAAVEIGEDAGAHSEAGDLLQLRSSSRNPCSSYRASCDPLQTCLDIPARARLMRLDRSV